MSSKIEQAILSSQNPIPIDSNEVVNINGVKAIIANKAEVAHIKDINNYKLYEDKNPQIIKKKFEKVLDYKQEIGVRILKSNVRPPVPGKLIIRQEADIVLPPPPPLVVRQVAERVKTPAPIIVRQAPPKPPVAIPEKVIVVPGKQFRPVRKVVLEKLPPVPPKPQSILIEKWLPYEKVKRKVIYEKPCEVEMPSPPKNIVIEWETPCVRINKEIKNLGTVIADPEEYRKKYKFNKRLNDLPATVLDLKNEGIYLDDTRDKYLPELEGDLEALKLIDLDKEGLSEYKSLLGLDNNTKSDPNSVSFPNSSASVAAFIESNTRLSLSHVFQSNSSASAPVKAVSVSNPVSMPASFPISASSVVRAATAYASVPVSASSLPSVPAVPASASIRAASVSVPASSVIASSSEPFSSISNSPKTPTASNSVPVTDLETIKASSTSIPAVSSSLSAYTPIQAFTVTNSSTALSAPASPTKPNANSSASVSNPLPNASASLSTQLNKSLSFSSTN